jgi:hypothetical protein
MFYKILDFISKVIHFVGPHSVDKLSSLIDSRRYLRNALPPYAANTQWRAYAGPPDTCTHAGRCKSYPSRGRYSAAIKPHRRPSPVQQPLEMTGVAKTEWNWRSLDVDAFATSLLLDHCKPLHQLSALLWRHSTSQKPRDSWRVQSPSTTDSVCGTCGIMCVSGRLQMNGYKSEIFLVWLTNKSAWDLTHVIGSDTIQSMNVVRDFGVWLDSHVATYHDMKVTRVWHYQLCRLRQTHRPLGQDVTARLVFALIASRLVYCKAAFAGLIQCMILTMMWVQNAAARLVFKLGPRDQRATYAIP